MDENILMTKRICFFAHYDRDHLIDDYVVLYLKELRKVCNKILFSTDSNLSKKECEKLKGIANVVPANKTPYLKNHNHGEYDFGSWKRCFKSISKENLQQFDELLLVNDTCFAPFFSFKRIFKIMEKRNLETWGMNWATSKKKPYLDSSFLVLKNKVFSKDFFQKFLLSIKKEKNIQTIISKYEVGFSKLLTKNKITFNSYIPIAKNKIRTVDSYTCEAFKEVSKNNFPLLKTKIFKKNNYDVGRIDKRLETLKKLYPIRLIKNYIKRICGEEKSEHYFLPYSRFRTDFLHYKFLQIFGKYTKSKKWFYIGIKLFSIPVFRFWIPVLKRRKK